MSVAGRRVALVAHDAKKAALVDWAGRNRAMLARYGVVSTGTTGGMIRDHAPGLAVEAVLSGPMGGDAQIGGMIAEGKIAALIFFPDPLTPMPHDVDVQAIIRLAILHDVPVALNPATADLLVEAGAFGPGDPAEAAP